MLHGNASGITQPSESQLQTWSNQGATESAKRTHESIRAALSTYPNWPADVTYNVTLQGSYKNSTNIYGDSDVDILVELTSSFRRNLDRLTNSQIQDYNGYYSSASHGWDDFYPHVNRALVDYYGSNSVEPKSKCIEVDTAHLGADAVVCQSYRNYGVDAMRDPIDLPYAPGIILKSRSTGEWIKNYPKLHFDNGATKNQATSNWYKPTVRCFKNARSRLVLNGVISKSYVPSYFVECMLYNVPNTHFGSNWKSTFADIIEYLDSASLDQFTCQNGIQRLFGSSSTQWDLSHAGAFILALKQLNT
jgi:hypothetical protein